MRCPYCQGEMDEQAGYSDTEDDVFMEMFCSECSVMFDGILKPRKIEDCENAT